MTKLTEISTNDRALATSAQRDAERALIQLLDDADLCALQRDIRAELADMATGQHPDGAAEIDNSIAQWTSSMIFTELSSFQPVPAFLWTTDNTPRSWFGHTLGGAGIAGDNPDFIYRRLTLEGAGRHEITGRINLAHRPVELTIEVMRGNVGPSSALKDQTKKHADMGNQVAVISDRELTIGADGSFRITLARTAIEGDHLATEAGEMTILIRDVLSDWSQQPAWITIREIERVGPVHHLSDLKKRVLSALPNYIRFWANYHLNWFGGLQPNSYAGPVPRDGGWGFITGARFALQPGEALLITTTSGGAQYTGFQLAGPWLISPDRTRYQSSLNIAQVISNWDGSVTYLVSPDDPGVANWVDSAGLHSGFILLRWQAAPAGVDKDDLIRDFRVLTLTEAATLPGVPRVAASRRLETQARQGANYATRTSE